MSKRKTVTGWHFAGDMLRNGRPLPTKGMTIRETGEIIPCEHGLHASERALDALRYAPGWNVARVQLSGTVVEHGNPVDKHAASRRKNLTDYMNAKKTICEVARQWALRAARVHAANYVDKRGRTADAARLRALPDDAPCELIRKTAYATAYGDATSADDATAAYAADAASYAAAADTAASAYAVCAACAASAAAVAYAADAAARQTERDLQNKELTEALEKLIAEDKP